jgi:hypothetical protein
MNKMNKLKNQIAEARAEWLKNLISSDGYGGNDTLIYGVRMYLRALGDVEEMIHEIEGSEG